MMTGNANVHRRRWVRSLVVVAGLGMATACADAEHATPSEPADVVEAEVRPFELVQASELVFEADPADPTRGIFRVETTEPMICAIVWGPDEGFGRFNNSLAMTGTGITDHDVFLPDIEPGRQYHFVVQGTTADGTLYRSPTGTFRIDTGTGPPSPTPPGDNLALGATVSDVSSEFNDAFVAANAVDGDTTSEWSTDGDGDDGFLVLDLDGEQRIGAVEYVTRTMADGSATTLTYTVTVDDQEPVGPFAAGTLARPQVHTVDLTGRTVRIDVDSSTGGNVGAVEVRLYGP